MSSYNYAHMISKTDSKVHHMHVPSAQDVDAAWKRLQGVVFSTPVLTSFALNERLGTEIVFKCENLQYTGSFKFRGAYNALSGLSEQERRKGVLTLSSGNHAQAVALVGRMLDMPVTVVMPDNASRSKRAATEGYGARVVDFDPAKTSREAVTSKLLQETGMMYIPPFDHPLVIAGQGTAGLELMSQEEGIGTVLVPCGGGGLLSGMALACKAKNPECRMIGVEPELADDAARSFASKTLHRVHNPQTIADGTRTPCLGELTFPLIMSNVDDMVTVSEESIQEAVRFFQAQMKIVVEPSGALGLAALLQGGVQPKKKAAVLVSGGNVDESVLIGILRRE